MELENTVYRLKGVKRTGNKVAIFTFINTLILSGSGSPEITKAWLPAFDNVYAKLQELAAAGYTIVIMDSCFSVDETLAVVAALATFVLESQVEPFVYLSTEYGTFNLPEAGMFKLLWQDLGLTSNQLSNDSFVCASMTSAIEETDGPRPISTSTYEPYKHSDRDTVWVERIDMDLYTPDSVFGAVQVTAPLHTASLTVIVAADERQFIAWLQPQLERNHACTVRLRDRTMAQVCGPEDSLLEYRYINGSAHNMRKEHLFQLVNLVHRRGYRPIVWLQVPDEMQRAEYITKLQRITGGPVIKLWCANTLYVERAPDANLEVYYDKFQQPDSSYVRIA